MKKRFFESEAHFKKRLAIADALANVSKTKLWRIHAIEMTAQKDGGWRMGVRDHFTVEACSEEMAVGIFKCRAGKMSWFVVNVEEEIVSR